MKKFLKRHLNNLKKHPYKCLFCKKTFICEGALLFHNNVIHNEIEHFCKICQINVSSNIYLLYNHLVTAHGKEDSLPRLDVEGLHVLANDLDYSTVIKAKCNFEYLDLAYDKMK